MEKLQRFYQDTGFILAFLVLVLVIQMTLGQKFSQWFLYLVLFSMIIINSDRFITFVQEALTVNE